MRVGPIVRALVLASFVGVLGCATTLWWGNKSTTLSLGMSKQQVQTLLGPPQQIIAQQLSGMMIETWKYLDHTLIFQNGVLQSSNSLP